MDLTQRYGLMMKKSTRFPIPAFALVALFLVSGMSYGFKQEDLDKLSATGQCPFCDLSHADLPAADLSGKRLAGARLSDANLPDAKLSNANLRNANLSRAKLTNANLSGADLSGADMVDAQLRVVHPADGARVGVDAERQPPNDLLEAAIGEPCLVQQRRAL